MPHEVKWWMRWLLAGVAFVCFLAGGAVAAYLMHERTKDVIQREREKNAELAARLEELNSEERRIRKEIVRMSEYEKAALRGMYLRPRGRELAIDHVENPEAMPLVRKGITELSAVYVDDSYKFVYESLTLAAHDVIRAHPDLVGIESSDMSVVTELTAKLDERKRLEKAQARRDEDADMLLMLLWPEYAVIDDILTAEKNGGMYRHDYNVFIEDLYEEGVIRKSRKDGDVYTINAMLQPFFERYAQVIHDVANGSNDDRLRAAAEVRDGTLVV